MVPGSLLKIIIILAMVGFFILKSTTESFALLNMRFYLVFVNDYLFFAVADAYSIDIKYLRAGANPVVINDFPAMAYIRLYIRIPRGCGLAFGRHYGDSLPLFISGCHCGIHA